MQDKLRKEDVLARLGGDEFVILLEEVSGREGAERVAQLALDADPRHRPKRAAIRSRSRPASASAPPAATGGAEARREALLAEADQAMYAAKQAGKSRYALSQQCPMGRLPDPRSSARAGDGGVGRVEYGSQSAAKLGYNGLIGAVHNKAGEPDGQLVHESVKPRAATLAGAPTRTGDSARSASAR